LPELAPTEIKALARIIDDLDYYQLLHLEPGANVGQVKKAYYATSRVFHPDANRHLAPDLQESLRQIAKRVTEAYSILRDPRRRKSYDDHLGTGEGVRMQLAQAQAQAGRRAQEDRGRTPQGRQYFNLASGDFDRGDFASAERNLQTALTFEPGNATFQQRLAEVREKLK